jgi:hypothetical protein
MTGYIRTLVVMCGVASGILSTGCSSNDNGRTAESNKATTSMKDTRTELVKAKGQVNNAVAALDKLSAGGNLQQNFKTYTAAVKDVQTAGDKARARATAMKENGRAYVAKWEKEMDQVSNPELRAGAAARRQKIKANYESILASGRSVRDAYQPFLKDLQDIQRALASDLTPGGVSAAAPAIDKTKSEGMALNERIDALIAKLDDVSSGMDMEGAPAAQAQTSAGK